MSSGNAAGRMRKQVDGLPHKTGPMKATLPMSSVQRVPIAQISGGVFSALSPPLVRHISPPERSVCGHRSPGASNFTAIKGTGGGEFPLRRTASLDALYARPAWCRSMTSSIVAVAHGTVLLGLDKATQTGESYLEQRARDLVDQQTLLGLPPRTDTPTDIKIEKVLRQRLQRGGRSGAEHSVSSTQTLSPIHAKATPVLIPPRTCPPSTRPMRNSVEGLNQEIEKLVLQPGQQHTCRPETNLFSRGSGTPDGHRAAMGGDTRSVNTQTPNRDLLSDESQSTSPEEDAPSSGAGASPRINRFLAREPPDGCEKVSLKLTETDQHLTGAGGNSGCGQTLFKPCVGFLLRPSLGSAFQPIVAMSSSSAVTSSSDGGGPSSRISLERTSGVTSSSVTSSGYSPDSSSQLLRIIDDDDDGHEDVIKNIGSPN